MTQEDWDKAGGCLCPLCNKETVRIVHDGKWSGCPDCHRKYVEKKAKLEASLSGLVNSRDPKLASRARRYLAKHAV